MAKVIIIDDDIFICQLLDKLFRRSGHESEFFTTGKNALEHLKSSEPDIIFCDYRLPDTDGREMLLKMRETHPHVPVVIISSYDNIKTAVELIKLGAHDFIKKPLLPEEIQRMFEQVLQQRNGKTQHNGHAHVANGSEMQITEKWERKNGDSSRKVFIVGKSKEARKIQGQIGLVASTNYSVIIYGESGTGKESVAYSIHAASPRRNNPFVAVDCGALTKELAGSELFGHEKGAFTGALQSKIGQFELANHGTIFLDEITNLPYDIQVSLLRVIQERKIRRLGSSREINIDIRILVASNKKLDEAACRGEFREDLYHRFNEFSIDLPPLRERKPDIMIFADFFLGCVNSELGKSITGFSEDVQKTFMGYHWTGNLRQMNNTVKRAALLCSGSEITADMLPAEMVFQAQMSQADKKETGTVQTVVRLPELKSAALNAEYEMILKALRKVNFNKSAAAVLLNIDRKTLYNKMRAFSLQFNENGAE